MHPWEDFAETFAHYLHIVDTLETANAFGIRIRPKIHNGMLGRMSTLILIRRVCGEQHQPL
jgi:hypothetical protein